MQENNKTKPQQQEGSGSAENTGRDRDAQKTQNLSLSDEQKEAIAGETGLQKDDISDIQETGALSGRDDLGGGSGDGMENTSTGYPTEKF